MAINRFMYKKIGRGQQYRYYFELGDKEIVLNQASKKDINTISHLSKLMNETQVSLSRKLDGLNGFTREQIRDLSIIIRFRVIELLTNDDIEKNGLYGSAWIPIYDRKL